MIKILFVCHGNICRSPMAEFVMKDLLEKEGLAEKVYVASAATSNEEIGNDIHYGTREIFDRYGISYEHRAARRITKQDYAQFDYLVGMDGRNMSSMKRMWNNDPQDKVSLLMDWTGVSRDVADPWYTHDFDTTYDDVLAGCLCLLQHITKSLR